ncbi:tetratricopeptide repeat-containing sulfotransferase family protein [Antarctobacter heliothermus]|uniref:Tfp pilus assembly protein PilF n=1 Tax=Antarctobacter heliothermus TaxID=74033 RepID=A0A239D5C2_9RHOB|nr:sulfotransferase [Antarctobacter heliothermus]SNS27497.1 Tfp pilus assembly protein PilF [Antarctobacter heliothermus]
MQSDSFAQTLDQASALIDTKDTAAAQALLDGLPARWASAPEVFALRHLLFTRTMPALLQQPLRAQDAHQLSALLNARRLDAALTLARKLAAHHPHAASPHEAMALAFNAGRRFAAARDAAQTALVRAPDRATLYRELALALYELGEFESMGAPAQHAAEALGDDPLAQRMGAIAALIRGERDMARARFARLAELQPQNGAAHRGFAELHRFTDSRDPQLKRMVRLLKSRNLPAAEQLEFHFALGKAFDDLDLPDKAFDHFARGNALKKKLHGLGATRDIEDGARVRTAFAALRPPEATPPDPLPILVCGLPRSGTTLTESILAAHPQVAAAGELTFLRRRLLPLLREDTPPTDSTLSEVRDAYQAILRTHAKGRPFVVDKMPLNFVLAGYLAKLIPGTRIVALHREPRALGWSIFRQCFVRTGNGFAYDLRDIAEAMALYRQMIGFWEDSGVAVHRLDYGALTRAPDATVQALLAGLQLPPDPACVDFASSDRAVVTASALQVREGIQRDRDQAWHRYERHLAPLVDQLRHHGLI